MKIKALNFSYSFRGQHKYNEWIFDICKDLTENYLQMNSKCRNVIMVLNRDQDILKVHKMYLYDGQHRTVRWQCINCLSNKPRKLIIASMHTLIAQYLYHFNCLITMCEGNGRETVKNGGKKQEQEKHNNSS